LDLGIGSNRNWRLAQNSVGISARADPRRFGTTKCLVCDRFEISGFSKTLSPTLVLRHTRALEMIRAGVPLMIVQQILGHAYLNTTAIYLQFSGQEAKSILKDRGLI
jgi:site-specific recombinase XerD